MPTIETRRLRWTLPTASGGNRAWLFFGIGFLVSFSLLLVARQSFAQNCQESSELPPVEDKQNSRWWLNRVAPAAESLLSGYIDVNELGLGSFGYAKSAAEFLLAPLDLLRAFTWDELWHKEGEDPRLDRPFIEHSLVILKGGRTMEGELFWFVLTRRGERGDEALVMARWIQLGEEKRSLIPNELCSQELRAWRDEDVCYPYDLEIVLRTSSVTELKCKTAAVKALTSLAARVDDLHVSPKVLCKNYTFTRRRLPNFSFRIFGGQTYLADIMGSVGCGEGTEGGNLLSWYRQAVTTLREIRDAVEKRGVPGCSVIREDGLTFLEKRPPHPPLEEGIIIKEVGQAQH